MATQNTYQPQQYSPWNGGYYTPIIQPQPIIPNYIQQQQQAQQTPITQPQQNQQQVKSSRVWVQGEGSAKAYIVANNTEQELWDSEQPVIYLKTVDVYGRPNMVILDYTIRPAETSNNGVASSEVSDLKKEMAELKEMMNSLVQNQQQRSYKNNYNNNKKEIATND